MYLDEAIFKDNEFMNPKDSIVESVIDSFRERSEAGYKKYGTNLDRKDLSPLEWLIHLQQEMQDGILYAEKLKQDIMKDNDASKVTEVEIKTDFGNLYFDSNGVKLSYDSDGTKLIIEML